MKKTAYLSISKKRRAPGIAKALETSMSFISNPGICIRVSCPRASGKVTSTERVHVGPFWSDNGLTQKQTSILKRLTKKYAFDDICEIIVPIITQQSGVSLRAVDWLVTNYSKKKQILLSHVSGDYVNLFNEYKVALSHFKRRNFDPFRRRQRIHFSFNDTVYDTTVGQLNFLMWAHNFKILEYVVKNATIIENDMNQTTKFVRSEKKKKYDKKRGELTKASKNMFSVHNESVKIF